MNNIQGTDSKKVVKAGAGYVIGNYLLKGITFLSAPIFTRLLTTADFGDFNTYISYEAIIYIFVGLAIHSSINNAKYIYKERLNSYVSSIVLLVLLNSLLWFGLVNSFYDYYGNYLGLSRDLVNVLIFHCLCSSLLQIFNSYVSLEYSVKAYLKITSFNGVANIVISVLLVLTFFSDQRCLGRVLGTVIPLGIIAIYIIYFFFSKAMPTFSLSFWKYGVVYSLPIIPHGISHVILSSFDRIMIKQMIGSAESGIYSFAYTINSLINVASSSLGNVWKPWLYEKMELKDYSALRKQGTRYALGMSLFTVLVLMVSPELIKILGDEAYWGSTSCVVPVVIGGFFSFLYSIPVMIEYYYSKTKYIAVGTMIAAALNVILNYFYIGKYGYIAAAYTTLVTYIIYFVFHYCMARIIHGSSVFNTKWLVLISAFTIFMGGVVMLLEKQWIVRWLLELIIGIFACAWGEREFGIVTKVKKYICDRKTK